MKRLLFLLLFCVIGIVSFAQDCYWVFFTDKQGTSFNPYNYFDAKAIERYKLNNADLYDITNYPLNESYVSQVSALSQEEIGASRWMNAVAVEASVSQVLQIRALPFVLRVQPINSQATLAQYDVQYYESSNEAPKQLLLADQLIRQQGQLFKQHGIDGKGVRVAVFDGGFPLVNTHEAFKHLRDDGRILKTWNFCNKKEDVYGWSTHGTMVLSCIAGIRSDSIQLGLATGAEFLLARTEVNAEPFKEEVWWMQAMEWADKNGAQVINSSLGYGKERHYTKDMDGTSYVAKAANMAARKGIVVCNSAGNEGDDKRWKTIITPADADSVLAVGGIKASLTKYEHIDFSSYGPSADGRLKPNVCNFGFANVASPSGNDKYDWVYGTSFSSPLTAGFVACAIQAHPGLKAMDMKAEIEQSADLYPYYDYAFGYGVPQASYFVEEKQAIQPTFKFVDFGESINIYPTKPNKEAIIFFNSQWKDSKKLERYDQVLIPKVDSNKYIAIHKSCLTNRILNVCYDGYVDSYQMGEEENRMWNDSLPGTLFSYMLIDTSGFGDWNFTQLISRIPEKNHVNEKATRAKLYYALGTKINANNDAQYLSWLPVHHIGLRFTKPITKSYSVGLGVEWNYAHNRLSPTVENSLDQVFQSHNAQVSSKCLANRGIQLDLYQRVRLMAGGLFGNGFVWDLGAYLSNNKYSYSVEYTTYNETRQFAKIQLMNDAKWNWGVQTRIIYDVIGVYASYRFSRLQDTETMALPRLELGLQLSF